MHPVARLREVLIYIIVCLLPGGLRPDRPRQRAAPEVARQAGRVRVRVLREDVVDVVVAREGGEDVVVAGALRARADAVGARLVALRDQIPATAGLGEALVCTGDG